MVTFTLYLLRVKRELDELVRGGVKPGEPVHTAVSIFINERHTCSGTVLSNFWVGTAGHCFEKDLENVKTSDIEVVAGVMNLMSDDRVKVAVKRMIRHPNYKIAKNEKDVLQELDWDLALLELDRAVTQDTELVPVCLPPGVTPFTNMQT